MILLKYIPVLIAASMFGCTSQNDDSGRFGHSIQAFLDGWADLATKCNSMSQVWLHIIGIFALVFFGVLVLILIWQTNGAKQRRLLNAAQQHYDNSEALRAMTHKMNEESRLQLQEANQRLMDLYTSIKIAEEELHTLEAKVRFKREGLSR